MFGKKTLIDYLLSFSVQPAWVFLVIVLASYILEDLAIIAAAVIAADQIIPVPLAFYAILMGIVSGDIGLYLIGHYSKKHPALNRWLNKNNRQQRYERFFESNLIKNILLIRFVPGLRFVCYTSCGVFRAHFGQFIVGVAVAGILWVSAVFTVIYQLGTSSWLEYSEWKWMLIPVALMLLIVSNRQIVQRFQKQEV